VAHKKYDYTSTKTYQFLSEILDMITVNEVIWSVARGNENYLINGTGIYRSPIAKKQFSIVSECSTKLT